MTIPSYGSIESQKRVLWRIDGADLAESELIIEYECIQHYQMDETGEEAGKWLDLFQRLVQSQIGETQRKRDHWAGQIWINGVLLK